MRGFILVVPILLASLEYLTDGNLTEDHIYSFMSLYSICIVGLFNNKYFAGLGGISPLFYDKEVWALFFLSQLFFAKTFMLYDFYEIARFQLSFLALHISVIVCLVIAKKSFRQKEYEYFYASFIFLCSLQIYSFLSGTSQLKYLMAWSPINLFFNVSVLTILASFLSIFSLIFYFSKVFPQS